MIEAQAGQEGGIKRSRGKEKQQKRMFRQIFFYSDALF